MLKWSFGSARDPTEPCPCSLPGSGYLLQPALRFLPGSATIPRDVSSHPPSPHWKLSCERVSSASLCTSGLTSSLPSFWLYMCLGAYVHLCVCVRVCEPLLCRRSYNLCVCLYLRVGPCIPFACAWMCFRWGWACTCLSAHLMAPSQGNGAGELGSAPRAHTGEMGGQPGCTHHCCRFQLLPCVR